MTGKLKLFVIFTIMVLLTAGILGYTLYSYSTGELSIASNDVAVNTEKASGRVKQVARNTCETV